MADRCGICRGSEFVDAIDNHGEVYRGCARCRIVTPAPPLKPRRWRKVGPHEYALRMGPIAVEVDWYRNLPCGEGEWTYRATVGAEGSKTTILSGSRSAPLAQCQADAIAAVERWRDGIR